MGAVFVAEQIATELTVAIKVLFPHILASQDSVEKFQFEAKVAARVKSDHIVQVLDAGYDDESGLPFLVMELLDGKELDAVVQSQGPLSFAQAAEYIRQVAAGLDKAHAYVTKEGVPEPIVHRDLKPENLFLARRENGEAIVKILDFGIAKVLSDNANVSQEIKGTPLFMAFEQATGKALSPQTDIWALGLIAFYLMTGEVYWKAASNPHADVSTLFAEVLNLPLDPPSRRATDLGRTTPWPPGFDAWFGRCVHRDPEARFASAGEAARELAVALDVSDQLRPPLSRNGLLKQASLALADGLDATFAGSEHLGATMPEANPARETTHTAPGPATPPGMATEGQMALSHTRSAEQFPGPPGKKDRRAMAAALLVVAILGGGAALSLGVGNGAPDAKKGSETELVDAAAPRSEPSPSNPTDELVPKVEVPSPSPPLPSARAAEVPGSEAINPSPKSASQPNVAAKPSVAKTTVPFPVVPKSPPRPKPQLADDPYGER